MHGHTPGPLTLEEETMRIKYGKPSGRVVRLLAASVGAVAAAVFVLPTSATASPQEYSASQLSSVSNAVTRSGVEGIAWYVDAAADRVAVTADSSVSAAEIATVR